MSGYNLHVSPQSEFLDESLKIFSPCYSQSPLQLCLEISISSNSRNLLQVLEFSCCILKRRKEENLIENHTPRPMVKKSMQKPQVWELSRSFPETSTKFYVHEFGFCTGILLIKSCETYCSKFSYLLVAILGGQCSGRPLPDEHRWWDGQPTGTTGKTLREVFGTTVGEWSINRCYWGTVNLQVQLGLHASVDTVRRRSTYKHSWGDKQSTCTVWGLSNNRKSLTWGCFNNINYMSSSALAPMWTTPISKMLN